MREPHQREHVELDLRHLARRVELDEVSVGAHPRVVDEDVDGALRVIEPSLHGGDTVVGHQVGRERLDRDPIAGPELARERVEARAVARDQHQVMTATGERGGERAPDARGGTGDERGGHERASRAGYPGEQ